MEASGSKGSEEMVEQPQSEKSHADPESNMDKDIEEEMDQKLNEADLRGMLKVNSNKCIEDMRIKPKQSSRFDIPLCRMVCMPLVRPTLDSDIKRLEAEFAHGYRAGSNVFYVSICNECGESAIITEEELDTWGPLWREENELFEARLKANPHLAHLQGSKFFICDGNHRFKAWIGYISRLHREDRGWHISVDSICLDIKGKIGFVLNAMHDINK
jgi:hypothetical protein